MSSSPSREEILQNLKRVLLAAPEDLLHMRSIEEESPCGTARCLLGWAMNDAWFVHRLGLEKFYHIYFDDRENITSMFQLSHSDAEALFAYWDGAVSWDSGPHSVTKAEVLENLERLIKGEPAEFYAAAKKQCSDEDEDEE